MDLEELKYKKSFSQNFINEEKEIITYLAFSNFQENFPLLDRKQKSDILNYLINFDIFNFVPEIDIRDVEIFFPKDIEYFVNLEKIILDDYNLNKFLQNSNAFGKIKELSIYTESLITPEKFNFNMLRSLTLVNMGKQIIDFPQIHLPYLENMEICGYRIAFQGKLPKYFLAEDCEIINSSNLEGCQKMSLFTTKWDNPSVPEKELYIEDIFYNGKPKNLEIFHSNKSISDIDFTKNRNFKELRLTKNEKTSRIHEIHSVQKIIVDEISFFKNNMSFRNFNNLVDIEIINDDNLTSDILMSDFPKTLQRISVKNKSFSLNSFIKNLMTCSKNIEDIMIKNCNFRGTGDTLIEIPKYVKKLEIINCNSKNENNKIKIVSEKTIAIFKIDEGKIETNINNMNIHHLFTDIMLMNENDFIIECQKSTSLENFNTGYFNYLRDINFLRKYYNKYEKYLKILNSFPYSFGKFNKEDSKLLNENFKLHPDCCVKINSHLIKIGNLRDELEK